MVAELDRQHHFLMGAMFMGHLANDWLAGTLWILSPTIAVNIGLGPSEVGLILTINGISDLTNEATVRHTCVGFGSVIAADL